MSTDEQDTQPLRFPGHEFTQQRERLHLSLEQVSAELNLPIKVLNAIESANPQSFHNPVFLRGYIRTYAKHLGLDSTHYANLYASLPGVDLKPAAIRSTTSVQDRDPSRSPFMKLFSWLFVLAIIAVIVWWSREQYGRSPVSVEQAPVVEERAPSVDVFDPPVVEVPAVQVEADSDTEVEEEVPDTNGESGALDEPESSAVDQEVSVVTDGLYVRFSDDCWVQVRDVNEALLYSGVAQGGTELHLTGESPLSLVIGRRDAVAEMRFDGEQVDLSSFTSGNVARFTLPFSR
ncbi:putative membrane protein [Nitrincola lacisaponensis]|uniref:Putative membrane protein n=1 Tax=Nitrincola lacisaponensis TaxID=267850 RepID=A0A063Y4Z4_9GAMM|nr:RodZ domain-containing protein [Nitrincola lacisaponensis]KDE39577.1 putative membrane protein [Nitrincola lacisaponensis]